MSDADLMFELEGVFRTCGCAEGCSRCAAARMAYKRIAELHRELESEKISHSFDRGRADGAIARIEHLETHNANQEEIRAEYRKQCNELKSVVEELQAKNIMLQEEYKRLRYQQEWARKVLLGTEAAK